MRKVFWALGLTLVFNVAGTAQNNKDAPQAVDPSTDPPARRNVKQNKAPQAKSTTGEDSFVDLTSAANIEAQLQNTLDVKRARIGDEVILKVTRSVRQNGRTVIPKGTMLVGRVTEVVQRAKGISASKIGVVFERLQGRDGSLPVTASVVSITQAGGSAAVGDVMGAEIAGSGTTSARTSSGGTSGGLLGGVTNTVGGVANTASQTIGGVTDTATSTVGGTARLTGQTLRGLEVSRSANGSVHGSTMLSSNDRNVRLEKGLVFGLRVEKSGSN